MDLKAHALYGLNRTRGFTEQQLEAFSKPSDWLHRPTPRANHALWIVGHLGLADNRFAATFRPEVDKIPEGYPPLFWFGSDCHSDASQYPPVAEVLDYFRDRRANLLAVVENLTDADLEVPAPAATESSPIAGAPNLGYLLLFAAIHEQGHSGQLSVCRRDLGNDLLFGA